MHEKRVSSMLCRSSYRPVLSLLALVFFAMTSASVLLAIALSRGPSGAMVSLLEALLLAVIVAPIIWITAIRSLRSAAAWQRTLSTTVLDTMVDGAVVTDDRGIIQACNTATEQIFGYAGSELIGQNVKILIPSPHREQHDGYIAGHGRSSESKILGGRTEVVGERKDGAILPLDLIREEQELAHHCWIIEIAQLFTVFRRHASLGRS